MADDCRHCGNEQLRIVLITIAGTDETADGLAEEQRRQLLRGEDADRQPLDIDTLTDHPYRHHPAATAISAERVDGVLGLLDVGVRIAGVNDGRLLTRDLMKQLCVTISEPLVLSPYQAACV